MASFNDGEKNNLSYSTDWWNNLDHFCDKKFAKDFVKICCDNEFLIVSSNNFNQEKKYKKLIISFIDLDNISKKIEKSNFLSNISPPGKFLEEKNIEYNYISLVWIIKSNT